MTWIFAPKAWLNTDNHIKENVLIQLSKETSTIEGVFTLNQKPKNTHELVQGFSQQFPQSQPKPKENEVTFLSDNEFLTPSFVDCHTHLCMNFFRGLDFEKASRTNIISELFFKLEKELTYEDVYHFTVLGASESLLSGTGFVWDHYYHGKAVAEALKNVGLSGCVTPALQDIEGPGVQWLENQWEDTLHINENQDYLKHGIVSGFGPHAPETVSDKLWKRIVQTASEKNLPIHFHMNQTVEEIETHQAKWNCRPTERLEKLGVFDVSAGVLSVHNVHINKEECLTLAKKQNLALVFCPFSQFIFQHPADVMTWEKAKLNWMVANDTAASNDSFNVQKELKESLIDAALLEA